MLLLMINGLFNGLIEALRKSTEVNGYLLAFKLIFFILENFLFTLTLSVINSFK